MFDLSFFFTRRGVLWTSYAVVALFVGVVFWLSRDPSTLAMLKQHAIWARMPATVR